MTDEQTPRHPRRTAAIIIGVLVVVILAVTGIGLLAAGGATGAAPATTSSQSTDPASTSSTSPPTSSSAPVTSATATTPPTTPTVAATPQATKTTSISSTAPIVKQLTAVVTKSEAVQGKAEGPGEIAGPAVRFTITITNHTGKTVDLGNTVVNAYYGKQSTPANGLDSPGGAPFPQSVADGKSATGVFVFTIPKNQRSTVLVTVDTSVNNPVVAFRGSAPQ